jgi:DNA-binding beta-propeller fold protein YncE
MENKLFSQVLLGVLLFMAGGCNKKKEEQLLAQRTYDHGVYVLCEGNFGWGAGSVFYYDTSQAPQHQEDAYKLANGFGPGNVVQSMTISGDTAFLVVNNSNKVEILDKKILKRLAINSSLVSPRFALPIGNTLFVSDLYSNSVSILNRNTLALVSRLPAPGWTDKAVAHEGRVYITNRRTSLSAKEEINEQILVINGAAQQIEDSIKLGGQGAKELLNVEGYLYSSLEKDFALGNAPSIVRIDPKKKAVSHFATLTGSAQQPIGLQYSNGVLFWLQGASLCYQPAAGGLVKNLLPFGAGANLTGLLILRQVGGPFRVLVASSGDYISKGVLKDGMLDIGTNTFLANRETPVGVIPGQMVAF